MSATVLDAALKRRDSWSLCLVTWLCLVTSLGFGCGSESSLQPGLMPELQVDTADPYADRVVAFLPAEPAAFGHDAMPNVVLGRPQGRGPNGGSLDVVSLGPGGSIVLAFDDIVLRDGEGPDLLVFENAFSGWLEPGEVAVSQDAVRWFVWPCAAAEPGGDYRGCAGVTPVFASDESGIDPTDVQAAGGDAFDLGELGLSWARYVRVRDVGVDPATAVGRGAGFDLDAVAVLNGISLDDVWRSSDATALGAGPY